MHPDRITTERMTYGLGDMLGEVGGLFKMLDLFFGIIFGVFAPQRLFPYLAKALYRNDVNENENVARFMSQSTFEKGPKFNTYKLPIEVPKLIDLKTVWFKFFCCCKTKEYKAFM
jgi:hypothetical protein